MNSRFFWFNLNKVQPPLRGDKLPPGKRVGDSVVDPVKYAWFSNPVFRHAVSMAVDRDALIRSVFFGEGTKSWSITGPSNKEWHTPDLPHYDYNVAESKRLLAEHRVQGRQRRRRARRPARQSGYVSAEDERRQHDARGDGELHPGRSCQGRHPRHPVADRLQLPDYQPAERSSVRGDSPGLAERRAAGPGERAELLRSSGSRITSSSSSRSPRRRKKRASISCSTSS